VLFGSLTIASPKQMLALMGVEPTDTRTVAPPFTSMDPPDCAGLQVDDRVTPAVVEEHVRTNITPVAWMLVFPENDESPVST